MQRARYGCQGFEVRGPIFLVRLVPFLICLWPYEQADAGHAAFCAPASRLLAARPNSIEHSRLRIANPPASDSRKASLVRIIGGQLRADLMGAGQRSRANRFALGPAAGKRCGLVCK